MNIRYAGTLSEAQLRRLNSIATETWSPLGSTFQRVLIILIFGSLLLAGSLLLVQQILYQSAGLNAVSFAFAAVVVGLWWRGYKRSQRNPWACQERSGTITDEGFSVITATSTSQILWIGITCAGVREDAVVLLTGPSIYYGFPRSHFQNEIEWDQFKDYVVRRCPSKRKDV